MPPHDYSESLCYVAGVGAVQNAAWMNAIICTISVAKHKRTSDKKLQVLCTNSYRNSNGSDITFERLEDSETYTLGMVLLFPFDPYVLVSPVLTFKA